jgi:hypothetical protein
MTYLTNDKSFITYHHLFEFVVAEYHVGKTLVLTFKSTDGLKTIQKILSLKFIRERIVDIQAVN